MNSFSYDELEIGHKESFSTVITEDYMDAFRAFSGDENPLHKDSEYAIAKGFPDKVVFGMLTASFYSTLAGVYLPGEKCLLHEVNSKFKSPVFVGDMLTIVGTVTDKNDLFNLITVNAEIKNQKGQIVSKGKIILERSLAELQSTVCKVQIAFEGDMPQLPDALKVLHQSNVGRIHTLIVQASPNMAIKMLEPLAPILMEPLPLTLEEIFIYELGGTGYECKDILF